MYSSARYMKPNRRILIVDDNRAIHEDFVKTLCRKDQTNDALAELEGEIFGEQQWLTTKDFELTSAFQGEEALQEANKAREAGKPFALAFIDVRMPPGLDGIQTAAQLLKQDPEINVVICSAYSDHSWEEMDEALGDTDRVLILKKPFDTIEVRQLAHSLQKRWELARFVEFELADLKDAVAERTRALEHANSKLKQEAAAREEALSKLAESNEQVRALAYEDGLTGLPNRRLLQEHLDSILARSRRKSTEFALLFIDLDNFKRINDTIGHQQADLALRQFAQTLRELLRTDDVLASCAQDSVSDETTSSLAPITDSVLSRIGGDEFVILLPEIKNRLAAGSVAHRIIQRLEQPFHIAGQDLFCAVSIGIATYPDDGLSSEELTRNADTAMYHAKQAGRAGYQYYSAAMNAASVERIALETGLRSALEDNQLELYYQPQVNASTGQVIGAEALLRWHDSVRGFIPPNSFVPVAEDCGLIVPIGEWVIREACRQANAWQSEGLLSTPVSVNVSGVQFQRQDIVEIVRSALDDSGLQPKYLRIEIAETSLMSADYTPAQTLRDLSDLGVGIVIDDFGTGYTSLSDIKALPLDLLKIDRSFVADMLTDEATASIVEAIIAMARIMGLDVMAMGCETAQQLEFLGGLGCRKIQGFLYSEALPADEFARLLNQSGIRSRDFVPAPSVVAKN